MTYPTTLATSPDLIPGVAYLRLSDYRNEAALEGRAELLRTEAARHGVELIEVIKENDYHPRAADGKKRGASAFKRARIKTPSGRIELRTVRPGFRRLLMLLESKVARFAIAEDLDRLLRQPRDGEDLLDAAEISRATVISLSGSVRLTNGGDDNERFMARVMAASANKASADTARRVSAARARLAGASYGGGVRPFGFNLDLDSPPYRRSLLVNEAEAAVMNQAAADLLRGATLASIARDWNARGINTVRGGAWTPQAVRDVLMKPSNAAMVPGPADPDSDGDRPLIPAPWKPAMEPGVWAALRHHLANPARRTITGNRPRWLVSVFAVCGVCGGKLIVSGTRPSPAYVCPDNHCVGRKAGSSDNVTSAPAGVDDLVARLVVERLSQPDAADIARPAPGLPETEVARLRSDRAETVRRSKITAEAFAEGRLPVEAFQAASTAAAHRIAEIDRVLAITPVADPLAEFRAGRPAAEVWAGLSIERRRQVVQELITSVTVNRCGQSGRSKSSRFDRASVVVEPRVF